LAAIRTYSPLYEYMT